MANNDDIIKKIEAIDESVLPDKEEILRRLKEEADSPKKVSPDSITNDPVTKSNSGSNVPLIIGMFFQFIFTVFGGGMLISGLIAGFSVKWDTSLEDGVANISIVLAIVGGILFAIGIWLTFFLYKKALKKYVASKIKK